MKKILSFIWTWLKTSSHWLHLLVCLFGSFCFGYGFGIGAGLAAEYKDKAYGGKFDWGDLLADAIGTVIGVGLRLLYLGKY